MAGLIIPLFINMDFKRNANTDYIYNTLTSDRITRMSNGKIPKMSPEQAAGLIGSWIIETGDPSLSDPSLSNLDVVDLLVYNKVVQVEVSHNTQESDVFLMIVLVLLPYLLV
jgi:hypothetical protein